VLSTEILDYYRQGGEHTRLASGVGRLEFLRTWDVLSRVLPPAPAAVLDVGGATGVYAAPLARRGYRVHVVDAVPEHVEASSMLPGVSATLGDACTLAEPDASADAVLLLGPLYHLLDRADRVRAWREAGRVARPGAPVVGATITRYAALFDGLARDFYTDPLYRPIVESALVDGRHENPPKSRWFTTAYFHHPDEVPAEVADAGLILDRVVIVEGPISLNGPRVTEMLADDRATQTLLDMLRKVEDDASLLGASSHLLTIATNRSS
jgi:SAM-dependent methyltransferase